jgi:hypothetical protein
LPAADEEVVGERERRDQDASPRLAPHDERNTDEAGGKERQAKPVSQGRCDVVRPAASKIRAVTFCEMPRVEHHVGDELVVSDNRVRAHDEKRPRHEQTVSRDSDSRHTRREKLPPSDHAIVLIGEFVDW